MDVNNFQISSNIVVTCNSLCKSYGDIKAVDNVSFEVTKGEIFGIIGPDGAGKTTLFRMLTTLLLPDSGNASVDGNDILTGYKAIRQTVGYMPGKFSLYQDLTVEENLNFFATVFNTTIKENYHLIKDIYIQIEPFKTRRAGKLSGGMKQKLALCCALIHKPTVLFLDEPTTGVDTVSRKEFWEMLKRLKEQGIAILVSTPYMDEATLCDRIALVQSGKIMSIDTPKNIIKQYPKNLYAIKAERMSKLSHDLRNFELIESCNAFGEFYHITFINQQSNNQTQLIDYLHSKQNQNIQLKQTNPTIEDCFINLM